jgi:hypothetical protein
MRYVGKILLLIESEFKKKTLGSANQIKYMKVFALHVIQEALGFLYDPYS